MTKGAQLEKSIPAWEECSLAQRLLDSLRLLAIHGMASEGERDRILARIRKGYAAK